MASGHAPAEFTVVLRLGAPHAPADSPRASLVTSSIPPSGMKSHATSSSDAAPTPNPSQRPNLRRRAASQVTRTELCRQKCVSRQNPSRPSFDRPRRPQPSFTYIPVASLSSLSFLASLAVLPPAAAQPCSAALSPRQGRSVVQSRGCHGHGGPPTWPCFLGDSTCPRGRGHGTRRKLTGPGPHESSNCEPPGFSLDC
jgi:hypothetical protein